MTATESSASALTLPLIDLNSERREERRQVLARSRRRCAAILLILVLAGAGLVPLSLQALALHRELGKVQKQAAGMRIKLKSVTAASARMDGRIALWGRLVQTQQSRRTWAAAFPALAARLPSDVLLQQVQITTQDGGTRLQIQGAAGTMTGLRSFASALAGSPMFAQIHLDEVAADRGRLNFRLSGPITPEAASSPL